MTGLASRGATNASCRPSRESAGSGAMLLRSTALPSGGCTTNVTGRCSRSGANFHAVIPRTTLTIIMPATHGIDHARLADSCTWLPTVASSAESLAHGVVDFDLRIGGRVQAALRVLLQAASQESDDTRRRVCRERRVVDSAFEDRGDGVRDRRARKCRSAGQHFVDRRSQKAHKSVRLSVGRPRACSGLM